ncbi:major facilitator superfamily domain-containing protein [Mycena olivaceomarginata]|nr:major facilitator superfamily domain-containing protein [Mycena olivaceomarginata]
MSTGLHLQRSATGEKKSTSDNITPTLDKDAENGLVVDQDNGVTRIEALYVVFSGGWKIWMLYGSLAIISFVYALSQSTTYTYEAYAASSFESHALIGTIGVIVSIIGGVGRPFIAKISDISSRPVALLLSVVLYAIGYTIVAASTTIGAVAGGEMIYGIGNTGIDLVTGIILADITSLQWRGLIQGLFSMPFVITAFVAGKISTGISANTLNGWRWGYGMFVILLPITIAPALVVLFWGDKKAKKLGALSLASSSYVRRKQLAGQKVDQSFIQLGIHYWRLIDAFGLLLLGTGFTLILLPFTLYTNADNGWKNPSLIAMFVVGGILLIAFGAWEFKGASHPIMPRRVLNKTFLCCIAIDFMYYLSGYVTLTYFSSYVYVVKDWSLENYTYFNNILTVGLCTFSVLGGVIQRVTHRYKYLQLAGLGIRIMCAFSVPPPVDRSQILRLSSGQGLVFLAANGNKSDAVLVMSQVLTSLGGSFSVIGSQVATQASVPHQDMALAISLLSLWTSVGGGIGSAIAAAIWNSKLPANLDKYLGDQLNSTEIADIYGSIIVARLAEPRDLVIRAYDDTAYQLFSSCSLPVRRSPHCRVSNDQFLSWNYAQRDRGQGNTPAPW